MLWFHLSILSAAAKAANQAITKTLTRDLPVIVVAAYGQLAMAILIFPLIFVPGLINIPATPPFQRAAAITIIINIGAIIVLIEAIKHSDLSYALPFLGLTPVFTVLTGWLLRGEVITATGMLGILLVFIGTMGIDTISLGDWVKLGGKRIFKDKGVLLVILVALVYSISSVYDKTATLLSDPFTYVWYSGVIRAAALMGIMYAVNLFSGNKTKKGKVSRVHFFWFALLGITFTGEALFQMVALQTGLVAYVIAIKRLGILITSLVGIVVYKETFSWGRLVGAAFIVAGAAIIYVS